MYCSKDAPNFYFVLILEGCAATTAGIAVGCFVLSLLASVHGHFIALSQGSQPQVLLLRSSHCLYSCTAASVVITFFCTRSYKKSSPLSLNEKSVYYERFTQTVYRCSPAQHTSLLTKYCEAELFSLYTFSVHYIRMIVFVHVCVCVCICVSVCVYTLCFLNVCSHHSCYF